MASLRLFAARNSSLALRSLAYYPGASAIRTSSPRYFATTIMSSPRLLEEIKVDHDNIRDLCKRFQDAQKKGDEKLCTDIANTIIHEAAVHSDAEELSIYKMMDQQGMRDIAEKDRNDHQQVKQAMNDLNAHGISDVGLEAYAKRVVDACQLFLHHAEEEETDQLPRLVKELSEKDHTKAVDDFLQARKMAPTRPHPSAPQGGGMAQKAMGAMGKAADVAMDVGRNFVDLKYHHSDVKSSA
ncbi:uncharacterized protein UBRO2_05373 [Ustilago bromivora]|uniref:Hemerythrin-like domain-containing protein n=2 Tax=Ustilago bromivora TaxID=307758 RepID=A0A8H8QRK0_9BASI|nr:uncharacterized protein UBRO2_05373 [Ustilago bromivora]